MRRALSVLGVVAAAACQRGEVQQGPAAPPMADPATMSHFADPEGRALPELEPAWRAVAAAVGDATPRDAIVELTDGGVSKFDGPTRRLLIDRANLARRGNELVAHEFTHVALYALTAGESATDPFRFLDEGFANIVGSRMAGDAAEYKSKALFTGLRERPSLSAIQQWSQYFGGARAGRWWAYEVGSSFCFLVIDRFGEPALIRLFAELGRSHDLDRALRHVLQIDLTEAEARWHAYLVESRVEDHGRGVP